MKLQERRALVKMDSEIVDYVIKHKMTRTVQVVELSSFIFCGFLVDKSITFAAVYFIIGIASALISGEAMVKEAVNKKKDGNSRS